MAKRRGHGEGTIFYRDDKKIWVGEITLPNGSKQTKYAKTQTEVKDWVLQQRTAYKNGVLVANNQVTVGEFLDKWMEEVVRYQVRETTYYCQSVIIRKHIKPYLGEVRLVKLTPSHLQNLLAVKSREGYSKRTVKYIHTIVKQLLGQAKKWNLVATNIAEVVSYPKVDRKPVEPLTQQQANYFLSLLKEDRLYPLYVVFLSTGLRRGEALGLKWQNVDLVNGLLYIKGIIVNIKGKTVWAEPKTEASRRLVALPEFTQSVLIDHKLHQNVESEWVFCTSKGTPFSPRNILRHFKKMAAQAGLPPETTIHSLRHFFVSYALAQGVPVKDVQAIVGHADFRTTAQIYGHLMQGAQMAAAKKVNHLFDRTA
ncbi:MAG: site-specific integrase [Anaerolineaceae bacterium]|nr:site-specific integrase [Anaerolineaceae bacterium]